MKHFKYFDNETTYNSDRNSNYEEPWVSWTEGKGVNYNKSEEEKLGEPFTIEALGNGNITWALGNKTVQYSKNGGSWETMNSATTISIVGGDVVQFKGTNTDYSENTISSTARFNVKGNIMSLTGDNFKTADTVNTNCFFRLFQNCTYLVSAGDLKLPATTLANGCYLYMFSDCTGLTSAPELPATTLAISCYSFMFYGCTSLTTAPKLPATTLANACYGYMFTNCTGLTSAPELPATTLMDYCYNYMFNGCTKLNYIKAMFTTTPGSLYTDNWVRSVNGTGTFIKNSTAAWNVTGFNGVPSGWTVQAATE